MVYETDKIRQRPTTVVGSRDLRDNCPELVHSWNMGNRLAGVLRVTVESERLGAMEGHRGALLA